METLLRKTPPNGNEDVHDSLAGKHNQDQCICFNRTESPPAVIILGPRGINNKEKIFNAKKGFEEVTEQKKKQEIRSYPFDQRNLVVFISQLLLNLSATSVLEFQR